MNPLVSLTIAILLGVVGQGLLKYGVSQHTLFSLQDLLRTWPVLAGFATYSVSAVFYITSLRHLSVSAAFSSVSMSYFLVALVGYFFFNEPFGWKQITALLFITFGVYLMLKH